METPTVLSLFFCIIWVTVLVRSLVDRSIQGNLWDPKTKRTIKQYINLDSASVSLHRPHWVWLISQIHDENLWAAAGRANSRCRSWCGPSVGGWRGAPGVVPGRCSNVFLHVSSGRGAVCIMFAPTETPRPFMVLLAGDPVTEMQHVAKAQDCFRNRVTACWWRVRCLCWFMFSRSFPGKFESQKGGITQVFGLL